MRCGAGLRDDDGRDDQQTHDGETEGSVMMASERTPLLLRHDRPTWSVTPNGTGGEAYAALTIRSCALDDARDGEEEGEGDIGGCRRGEKHGWRCRWLLLPRVASLLVGLGLLVYLVVQVVPKTLAHGRKKSCPDSVVRSDGRITTDWRRFSALECSSAWACWPPTTDGPSPGTPSCGAWRCTGMYPLASFTLNLTCDRSRGLGLQFTFGVVILYTEAGYQVFKWLGDGASRFLSFSDAGTSPTNLLIVM